MEYGDERLGSQGLHAIRWLYSWVIGILPESHAHERRYPHPLRNRARRPRTSQQLLPLASVETINSAVVIGLLRDPELLTDLSHRLALRKLNLRSKRVSAGVSTQLPKGA